MTFNPEVIPIQFVVNEIQTLCLHKLPDGDFGLSGLHGGIVPPANTAPAPFSSSRKDAGSSSLSVKSSAPDSTPECSGDVTFTSSLSSSGGGSMPWVASGGEGGVWVVLVGSAACFFSASWFSCESASFCFWSCSFCRLRCFLRNFARLFLNQT